jgi:hypothetical protein
MARAVTETVAFANGWKNMYTQALADGYTGSQICKSFTVLNFNATVAYVHFHTSGSTSPTTAADGLPLSSAAGTAPGAAYTAEGVDLATVWVHTAGTQNIKYAVIG